MAKWSDEETDNPLLADHQNFYKVELWTKDEQRIERMLLERWVRARKAAADAKRNAEE